MTAQTTNKSSEDRDRQLKSLYIHLGRLIYENIESGSLSYRLESKNKQLEEKAKGLFSKIKDLAPNSPTEASQPKSRRKRGLLEPYTNLNVRLYEMKQKLLAFEEEMDSYWSKLALEEPDADQTKIMTVANELKEIQNTLILSIEEEMEVIKDTMAKRKSEMELTEEHAEPASSRMEKKFLTKAAADIENIANNTDSFINLAKSLITDFQSSYEKNLTNQETSENSEVSSPETNDNQEQVLEESAGEEETLAEVIKERQEELGEDPQEKHDEIQEDPREEQEEVQEEPEESPESHEEVESMNDELLESASRKLRAKGIDEDEKLEILNILVASIPDRVPDFLCNLIKDVDLLSKKQMMDLLTKVEHPSLLVVYKTLLGDDDSFLRFHSILALLRSKDSEVKKVIVSAVDDQDHRIRRLVANCLNSAGSSVEVTSLLRLANDSHEDVARIAIRNLGKGKNRFSLVSLIPKLGSPNIRIRKEAIGALRSMTGTDLGFRSSAARQEREHCIEKWKALWEENQTDPHLLEKIRSGLIAIESGASVHIKKGLARPVSRRSPKRTPTTQKRK